MICVSIGRSRHRHMMAEHRHLVEQGAKLVELRLDYIRGPINIKRLLENRPCPVVVTCRRERDGGKFTGSEEERLTLLRTTIAEGVDYVDLEDDIAGSVPRFGKTKRIVSHHDFRKTPDDLEGLHSRMACLDPDIVKIATMATRTHDNLRMLRLVRDSRVPTVGLCMGEIGVPSRVLAGKYGAPFTYATFHHERALAPGQMSFEQMVKIYRYEDINAETEVFAVIADPIGHSLSPLIHNTAFSKLGMNRVYLPIRVPREDISQFMQDAPELDIKGLSVTIPHKEAILPTLTKVDAAVKGIGACNTVVFQGDQRLGYNTDYRAALASIETSIKDVEGEGASLKGRVALVLGSGGAGRAVAFALIQSGAHVVVTDGRAQAAERLAAQLGCQKIDWAKRHSVNSEILCNCTPIGMHPNVDESPFDKHHMRPHMTVFDAVYNPESTLFIKDARSRNCRVVTGVQMFVRQACYQFKLFTGQPGPAQVMQEVIRRSISAVQY